MSERRTENMLGALAIGLGDRIDEAVAAETGLGPAESTSLLAMHARPGSSIRDLAASCGLSHSRTVRAVDRLETEGLARRGAAEDGRAVGVTATAKGGALARKALARRQAMLSEVIEPLNPREREHLAALAEKLLRRPARSRAQAWRVCRYCDHAACAGSDCPVGVSACEEDDVQKLRSPQ